MVRPIEGEPTYQRLLREPVTEDDQWSSDPSRKRLYLLHQASTTFGRFIQLVERDVTALPQNTAAYLRSGSSEFFSYFLTIPDAIPPSYQEQASQLVEELEAIRKEKGFRFGPSLLTSREHKEIGSTGYEGIYWDTDPDVPIPLLKARLIALGQLDQFIPDASDTYTIEEVDRARRLTGKTRLDLLTGRVTDQIDPEAANDSYYFLSSQRRGEIIQQEAELVMQASVIAKAAVSEHTNNATIIDELAAYIDGELTIPQLRAHYEAVLAYSSRRYPLHLETFIQEAKKVAFETGKWDQILTPQEILLRVGGQVDEHYLTRPYTPLAVQDGESVEEIASLRSGEQSMVINTALLEYEMPFGFRLEELDDTGNTVKSPTFLDRDYGTEVIEDEARSAYAGKVNFPFARPEDWFYKKAE